LFESVKQRWEPVGRGPNAAPQTFNMVRIRIFVTQVRPQHRDKTKLHDQQTRRQ